MGTITATVDKQHDTGDLLLVRGTLAFTDNYVSGGDSLAAVFTGKVNSTLKAFQLFVTGTGGYMYEYDEPNNKLLVREQTDPADGGGANIPLVEIPVAAYPAASTPARFVGYFRKFG